MTEESDAPPGVLLQHMRLPPADQQALPVAGPCRWSGPALACPPDGLCILYAWLASQEPDTWQKVAKDALDFILESYEEQLWKAKAQSLLDQIVTLMESEEEYSLAQRLRRGGYLGDEEFAFYARVFGAAFLATPLEDTNAFPVIHGAGPVHSEFGFVYSVDGAGHSSGHYVLLRSWAAATPSDTEAATPAAHCAQPAHIVPLDDSDESGQEADSINVSGTESEEPGAEAGGLSYAESAAQATVSETEGSL